MMVKLNKQRLMELAGIKEHAAAPGAGSNSFRTPGHMSKVNQAKEIDQIFSDGDDTVPSDDPEEWEQDILALDFD